MARRFFIALFAALVPVGAIVAHPQLRRILAEDIQLLYTGMASFLRTPASPERDALVHLMELPRGLDTEEQVKAYMQVAIQFDKPYLYAATLREAHRAGLKPPLSNSFHDEKWYQSRVAIAKQAVLISDRMITIDPENAFPYLSKMCAHLVMGQRQQAEHTLQRAAQCGRYESYEMEWMRIVGIPALTAETRTFILSEILFPHVADFREASRYWCEEANRLEQQGDHAGALRVAEHLTKVARLMLHGQKEMITPLVAAAIQNIAWGRQQFEPKYPIEDAVYLAMAQEFARHARQHGRSDLAEQTLQNAQEALRFRRLSREAQQKRPSEIWTAPSRLLQDTQTLIARRAAGIVLLWWVFPFATLWVLGKVLSLRYHTTPFQDGVGSWTIALIAASFPVAVLIAGLLLLRPFERVLDYLMEQLIKGNAISSLNLQDPLQTVQMSMAYPLILLILTAFLVPTVRLVRTRRQGRLVWSVIAGLLLTISVLSAGSLNLGCSDNPFLVVDVAGLVVLLFGVVSVGALSVYAFFLHRRAPLAFHIGVALLWGLGPVLLTSTSWVWILLWLMVGVSLWTAWAYSLSEENRPEPGKWLGRFAGAALNLALLCLWLYAVNGYLSLPLRNVQHHLLDRLSTEGAAVLWQELL